MLSSKVAKNQQYIMYSLEFVAAVLSSFNISGSCKKAHAPCILSQQAHAIFLWLGLVTRNTLGFVPCVHNYNFNDDDYCLCSTAVSAASTTTSTTLPTTYYSDVHSWLLW